MCQFGDESYILNEQDLTREQALIGYRNWYINNSFNNQEKSLKSTNQNFLWPIGEVLGNPLRNNSEGIYNYNINYNYNYNINYNYNYICGKTLLYGKIFSYKDGYRSSICVPTHLVILSDKEWFKNDKIKKFTNHFNQVVINLAKKYNCEVIGYNEFINSKL